MNKKKTGNEHILLRTLGTLGGGKGMWILAAVFAVISALGMLAAPAIIGVGIDSMFRGDRSFTRLLGYVALLVLIYGVSALFQWLLGRVTNRISYLTARDFRRRLFRKLSALPLSFFDRTAHGDTVSRFVNDVDAVSDGLLQGLALALSGVVTTVGAVFFMLALSPAMTMVVVLFAPLSVWLARFIGRNAQNYFRDQAEIVGRMNGFAEEIFEGRREMKAFRLAEPSFQHFSEMNRTLYGVGVKAQFYSSLSNPGTRVVNNIAYTVVGVAASLLAIGGHLSIGGISSFLIFSTMFAKPFSDITNIMTYIQTAAAGARRIFRVLDLRDEMPDAVDAPAPDAKGDIAFAHVRFAYDPVRPLIRDLDLTIPYGKNVAIVGRTGAGKTTLVNLLMRFYDVDGGAIRLGGADIRTFRRADLRRCFGMVLQDTWLFSGTIRENIAYAKPDATDEEVVAAAKQAGAHDFIGRLPGGYRTHISDMGEDLSQGQKQLLTIARVMLADPPMFILDEATSSIDTRTELRVQRAMEELTAGRTSFVIAHRLSTVQGADLILVMEDGDIVETGTHESLLAQNGAYARLYASRLETL
ncbi:ABC transporter ATP-binding protein [Ethanoligenens harbinense]|uniref:ABC transporter related protein n=1 Tax=Ethanoligenens harbinense (strain DSM 18485 / JCM 12961 / CGMCC 1.5033 / YUAN-3) TaxID=663278 RepID=E6U437_ETHHY|nr:ABC transporter ATP-binding protein [Ethanoligenens harbinense]ADU27717.1 ABC transporter related protein [Ethanoligenens harbinense YUAN-3]AVQ96747.1 ABC transporter ATP-binding protein [Ethanoligenens harbinense YUAN-3]AYF39409.1 ABC transporter ATP-binding protein [Ethanoligenens harbinense]AYF42233.1 ABC transporter ATP-binding protein [Ethanoligenens harbinense]QCN92989.1 ABC transporter ATP-binding protein [Ethanoligenens harbinense]